MKRRRPFGILIVLSLIITTFLTGSVYAGTALGVGECGVVSCKKKQTSGRKHSDRKRKSDTYDVHSYSDSQSFADDKWEEFYDYEDDYDDEDEAYDDAEDYWYDNY